MPNDNQMPNENNSLEVAKLVIEGIRALAWPVLLGAVLIAFNSPLQTVVESFSIKLSQANKVSIGSLSLEIEAKAREAGNPELGRQVGSLTAQAVQQLLLTPVSGHMTLLSISDYQDKREYGLPNPEIMAALEELERKEFLRFQLPLAPFLKELKRMTRSDTILNDSEKLWYSASSTTDLEEERRLSEQSYSLTEKGKQAVDAIVKAVAGQLSAETF